MKNGKFIINIDDLVTLSSRGEYVLHKKTELFSGAFYRDIEGVRGNLKDLKFFIWKNESLFGKMKAIK